MPNPPEKRRASADADPAQDYARIADAIAYLRGAQHRQPSLDEVARAVGLSPGHTQRLFTRWAGISPKRFLQYLTVESAKRRIDRTADVLSLALDAGLSGPGRLHDLFVTMEALSPGEFKRAAAGLTVRHGVGQTPFGRAWVAWSERGICRLDFLDPDDCAPRGPAEDPALARAHWMADEPGADDLLGRIFAGDGKRASSGLSLWISGTNFQIQVWRALLAIPPGGLLSYQHVARLIGRPTAARAVGNANAANPVGYLIPCHRVLRGTGEIGAYRWGTPRMSAMVGWEGARAAAD
jgi:AraC family transcriptional regulator of adaptative response/methylated-DNA-[protein]-cysteine methyltransferase